MAFPLSLPIIDANNIYRLKDVVNVGFWQGKTYVSYIWQLYLAPNLKMCTLTKDIHFLCPSKPFVRDNTEGICGLESIRPDTSCLAEATPRSQVEVTQAKIIGNRWLVNTPARTATLTYDQHDTATRISLPNRTLWITVPKGSILHIDKLALYHLTDDEYQAEIKISLFFKQHSFVLDPELEGSRRKERNIDLTPVDTALEAIARLPPTDDVGMAREAVRGGAPPHKNNLIGTAAGGVSKLVALKTNNTALDLSLSPRSSMCSLVVASEISVKTRSNHMERNKRFGLLNERKYSSKVSILTELVN